MLTRELLYRWQDSINTDSYSDSLVGGTSIPFDVDKLLSKQGSRSPRELAADEHIPIDHRLWIICRALAHRNETNARIFAIHNASLVTPFAGRLEDQAEHAILVGDLRLIFSHTPQARANKLVSWRQKFESVRGVAVGIARTSHVETAWEAVRAGSREEAWDAANATARYAAWIGDWGTGRVKALTRALEAMGEDANGWDKQMSYLQNTLSSSGKVSVRLSELRQDIDATLSTTERNLSALREELRDLVLQRDHALLKVARAEAHISVLETENAKLRAENTKLAAVVLEKKVP